MISQSLLGLNLMGLEGVAVDGLLPLTPHSNL
jgi:hypothetical protein